MGEDTTRHSELQIILTLRPNMSRDQVLESVSPSGLFGRISAATSPVRAVAELYVPFYVFRVETRNGARSEAAQLAIDAVNGTLDLYAISDASTQCEIETRNSIPPSIAPELAQRALIDKYRRMSYRAGFFALRDLQISATLLRTIHIPYWVVMLGSERDLKLRVFDAVRRRAEGAKVRNMIRQWLTSNQ